MGGDVTVESAEGLGSRFKCEVKVGLPDGAVLTKEGPDLLSGGKVLVVSPDLASTRALLGLLRELHLEVDRVSTREDIEPWRASLPEIFRLDAIFIDEGQLTDVRDANLLRAWVGRALRLPNLPRLVGICTVGQKRGLEMDAWVTRPVRRSSLVRALGPGEERVQPKAMNEVATEGLKVLVIDDNAVNRLIAVRFLEKLGCHVEAAANGADGLARLEARPDTDLVFMDCEMPGLDGLEVTRRLRAEEEGHHVPVVALTASAALEDKERCLAAGMDDFLAKPVTLEALAETVKRWSAKRAATAASS
jgi:CheY-like chemotaxis protein